MREIRLGVKEEKKTQKNKKKEDPQESLLTRFENGKLEGSKLKKEDVCTLLDFGLSADKEQKRLADFVKRIKVLFKEYGIKNNIKVVSGDFAEGKISKKTTKLIDPSSFIKLLKKLNKIKIFSSTVKVLGTEAKKYIAEVDLNNITKIDTDDFGTISIRPKK